MNSSKLFFLLILFSGFLTLLYPQTEQQIQQRLKQEGISTKADVTEELKKIKEDAQQQINSLQEQNKWISGTLNSLRVDKILIDDDGVHAILQADGFVDLI